MQRRNPKELNFEGLEMQKRIMLMDRTQNNSKGVICQIIIFFPGVMVIKIPTIGSLFAFSADDTSKVLGNFLMFDQIFFSPAVKRCAIIRVAKRLKT